MKQKFLKLLFFVCLINAYNMSAQSKTIKGTVSDTDGITLPGVSVVIQGTTKGTSTDIDGKYSLKVPNGNAVLNFSFIGYATKSISASGKNVINVTLSESAEALDEVVITALGIKKETKALGYAISTVKSEELTKVSNPSVVGALYGKAAGVMIKSNPGGPTAGVNVVIRGNNSITGFNQPLFIVDGIPIDHGDSDYSRWGGSDAGNGAGDINPDDIESMSILKGANASALYGSRAANGVVIITTKKGNGVDKGFGIDFKTSVTVEEVAYLPDYQNTYGAGVDSQVFRKNAENEDIYHETWRSFGPKMEGQLLRWWDGELRPYSPQPDNIKGIYKTGQTLTNNISVSKNTKNLTYRLSYSNLDYEGTFPGVKQNRNVFSVNSKLDVSDNFDIGLVANYYDIKTTNRPRRLAGLAAYEWPRSTKLDLVRDNYKQDGYFNGYISGDNAPGMVRKFMSELWNALENKNVDDKKRIIGNITFNYRPFTNFNIRGKIGSDFTNTDYITENASRNDIGNGLYRVEKRKTQLDYNELLLTYNYDINEDVNVTTLLGGSISKEEGTFTSVSTKGFIRPNWFSLNNSSDARSSKGSRYFERTDAVFGVLGVSYKDMLFIEATGRNDWSSTLPATNNSYFYPSVSTSFLFSEVLENIDWLSYGKVRASWAKTGNDAKRYQANKVYKYDSYNGATTNSFGSTVPPLNLLPESQESFEVGLDLKMFHNRFGIDFTYYHNMNKNQIIDLGVAPSTSSARITTNIGRMDNKGVEIQLYGSPIKTEEFQWDTRINFAKNNNKIIELAEGIDNFPLPSLIGDPIKNEARVGRPFGEWVAYVYKTDDDNNRIIDEDGLYVRDDSERVAIGNSTPDFIGGMSNTFRYKNFRLDLAVDFSVGGDMFSFTNYYGTNAGKLKSSLKYRDEEHGGLPYYKDGTKLISLPSHSATAPNGAIVYHDGVILDGVTEDGEENTKMISAFDYYINTYYWNSGFHEEGLFDNSYVKMREISLGYDLDAKLAKKIGFQNVSLSLIGRNLFYIFKNIPNIDPESALGTSSGEASAFESGAQAGSRSYGISIKLSL